MCASSPNDEGLCSGSSRPKFTTNSCSAALAKFRLFLNAIDTYNVRRDNLEKFWRKRFSYTHGVLVVNAFCENVKRHRVEGRELGPDEKPENRILEFEPYPTRDMLLACLWSRWTRRGESDLLSFAAITDELPPEATAAGQDRCIVPIKPENVDAWLYPDSNDLEASSAVLDDRERPYYEHRLAT